MSTQPSAPGMVSSRFSRQVGFLRDLPIWTKLGLIMIVPTIATIVVGTAGLLDQVDRASGAERARSLTVLAGDAGNLVHGLQDERALAIQVLDAPAADTERLKGDYAKQQAKTDAFNAKYRLSRSTIADVPQNLRSLLDGIETQLGELPVVRQQVAALNKVPLSIAERRYRVLITDLLEIRDLSAQLTGDTTLTDRMRAAAAVATAAEFMSQERVVILEALASNEMSPATRQSYVSTRTGTQLALDNFDAVATPDQQQLLARTVTGPQLRETLFFEGELDSLRDDQPPASVVSVADWDKAMLGRADLINSVETKLNGQAQDAAVALGAQVQRRVLVETGLLLVTLLLGVLFAWLVARSMARSLRDLRQGALAVAQYGLPQAVARLRDPALSSQLSPAGVALQIAEPLPVRSRDEFGQVTEAFNAVHLEAVRTAAEQAALRASVATMFVNLARRSQILVDRLIGHLDRLERGEQDPDRLGELFQLDHLATRMRRNDENLLVLAGADSTRIQREPAALTDVLRAAQSEVEHYTRIEFAVIDHDIEIAAHAVNDLVHLVAELFDNATAFSPPDTAIRIEARRVNERGVLRVEDRGIGMSPDQYAELNERLATPPMVDVAVSRMMGLVVVARLAARHGVKVMLSPARERGTIADVDLPSGVLVPRALAGRTHAPSGFPAVRPASAAGAPAPRSSPFGPPLALESGPSAGGPPPGWGPSPSLGSQPAPAYPPPPFYGAPPPGPAPAYGPPPGYGAPAPAYGAAAAAGASLGAALTGAGMGVPQGYASNGGPGNGNGRPMPAWFDLTGATGAVPGYPAPGAVPDIDPLPQRRPNLWDGEPETGGPVPRQGGWGDSAYPSEPAARPPAAAWPPVASGNPPAPPSRYADDLTMELPIFRELESAWFAPGQEPTATVRAGSRPGDPMAGAAMAGSGWSAATSGNWPAGSGGTEGARRGADEVSWRTIADDGWRAAEAAQELQDGGTTEMGLPRRVPMAQLVPGGVETGGPNAERRTPDSVRGLLSAYTRGVQQGRDARGRDADLTGSQDSGKEQEA